MLAHPLDVGVEIDATLSKVQEHTFVKVGAPKEIERCALARIVQALPLEHPLEPPGIARKQHPVSSSPQ